MVGKRVIVVGEELRLLVKIIGVLGVTDGRPYQYTVQAWTNANDKHETMVVPTEGDSEFNEKLQILQNKDSPAKFLFVDLFKTNLTGTYFVGRGTALVPTTKDTDVHIEVDLFGHEKIGFLQLSLNLTDFEILGYASS